MNIKTIITIVFSLIAAPAFAAESPKYPMIAGITISSSTTAAEYLVYFFNLAVAIGTFIAVVMIVTAGIEWVTSSGNPSKVESAKGKMVNTIFGVVVLLGCYLILDTINPNLTTIKINDLYCEHGIVVSAKQESDGKIKQKCIDSNQSNIADTILSTVKWNFPDKYLLKVYTYSEADFKGKRTEFSCKSGSCSGDISGAKSIYFVLNNPGVYLYDENSYQPGVKGYPLFTSISIPDLAKTRSFDNFTKSLEMVQPDQSKDKSYYAAVVFEKQNYEGRCAFVRESITDMDRAPSVYYTDSVGDNAISSIIVTKANLDQTTVNIKRGEVILYTKTHCGRSGEDKAEQIKECHIPIYGETQGQINISAKCGAEFDALKVMSFEITGSAGLVLSTSKYGEGGPLTSCKYFNKSDLNEGTCHTTIEGSSIYTTGGYTPESFIVLPEN